MKTLPVIFALAGGVLLSGCVSAGHVYEPAYGPEYGYSEPYGSFDRARVIAVEPIYNTVSTPVSRQVCREVPVRHVRRDDGSTAATILGGLIGGLAGHQIGSGSGNTAATVVGAIAGAAVGRRVSDGPSRVYYRNQTRCHMQRNYRSHQQLSGYHVTYRYNNETFTTRTARHPGDWIRVRVAVTPVE